MLFPILSVLGSFLTPKGDFLQISGVLCEVFSWVLCPVNSSCPGLPRLKVLSPQLRKFAGFCLFPLPALGHRASLKAGSWSNHRLTLFVSCLSGTPCLMSSSLKTVVLLCSGCYNKTEQVWWLINNRNCLRPRSSMVM